MLNHVLAVFAYGGVSLWREPPPEIVLSSPPFGCRSQTPELCFESRLTTKLKYHDLITGAPSVSTEGHLTFPWVTDPPTATMVRPIPLSSEAHPAVRENMKLEKIYPLYKRVNRSLILRDPS